MKRLIYIICMSFLFPLCLSAQSATDLLQKVTNQIREKKWNEAAVTFRQAIGKDVSRSDIYYRAEVDKETPVALSFGEQLAEYYKNTRNYDRSYNYYRDLLTRKPNDISYLSGMAECALGKGEENEAVSLYEKVLSLNITNLRANIFLGSYYFMLAEQAKRQKENTFKRIATPNSMQKAHFKDDMKALYSSDYKRSKNYLQNVLKVFPSTEAKKMLETIATREKEMM